MQRVIIVFCLAAGLTALLGWLFPYVTMSGTERSEMLHKILLVSLLAGSFAAHFAGNPSHAVKSVLLWIIVFLGLIGVYSFKGDLIAVKDRITAQLVPYNAHQTPQGEMVLKKSADGHFYVKAELNGVPVLFLLDTGASDITIAPSDAKRMGYDLKTLAFTKIYNTANGQVQAAPVTLRSFAIGTIRFNNVGASINSADMEQSLLGMGFLGLLKSYRVEGNTLVLTP